MLSQYAEHLRRHMRHELQALERTAGETTVPPCADENELASRLSERAVVMLLHERALQRIEALRDALRRMDVHDYGVCEVCGEEIPALRLLAAPAARLCVSCQEEAEDGAAGLRRRLRTA